VLTDQALLAVSHLLAFLAKLGVGNSALLLRGNAGVILATNKALHTVTRDLAVLADLGQSLSDVSFL
jgi:hypothetical protein